MATKERDSLEDDMEALFESNSGDLEIILKNGVKFRVIIDILINRSDAFLSLRQFPKTHLKFEESPIAVRQLFAYIYYRRQPSFTNSNDWFVLLNLACRFRLSKLTEYIKNHILKNMKSFARDVLHRSTEHHQQMLIEKAYTYLSEQLVDDLVS